MSSNKKPAGFLYLKLFIFFVLFLTLGVFVIRSVYLFQNRSFVSDSFTILYSDGVEHYLMSLTTSDPKEYSLVKVQGHGGDVYLSEDEKIQNSISLSLPIDAVVFDQAASEKSEFFTLGDVIAMLFFPHKYTMSGMNAFDALMFYFSSNSVPEIGQIREQIDFSTVSDERLQEIYKNEQRINVATSIEVVNATDVSGLGTRFATMLQNGGYNVISVSTSQKKFSESFLIQNREEGVNATFLTLTQLTEFASREVAGFSEIADIVVVLGEDLVVE